MRGVVRFGPRAVKALAGIVLLAGCGVSMQAAPAPIPSGALPLAGPMPTSASPSASPSSTEASSPTPTVTLTGPSTTASQTPPPAPTGDSLRLWFVQEDGLSAVESSLPVGTSPEYVMQALVVGPTPREAAQGLRTIASDPPNGRPLASVVGTAIPDQSGGAALPITVELSPDFTSLPPTEQVLLLGQVVLSLTGAGQPSVVFVDESGTPLAVPLPDGRLLDRPALARDFGPLIYRP